MGWFVHLVVELSGGYLSVLQNSKLVFSLLLFFIPFIILALLSLPSLPLVAQIRGRIAGPPPPSSPRHAPSFFIARKTQHFLPSSTRVELCAYPRCWSLSAVDSFLHFRKLSEISPRTMGIELKDQLYTLAVYSRVTARRPPGRPASLG